MVRGPQFEKRWCSGLEIVYGMSATVGTVNKINFDACESAVSATDITVSAVAARLQHIHIHTKAVRPCMMHGRGGHNAIRTK